MRPSVAKAGIVLGYHAGVETTASLRQLRDAFELRSEFFHRCIFEDNFTSVLTVQSHLRGD